jgi:WD40 repeat protein
MRNHILPLLAFFACFGAACGEPPPTGTLDALWSDLADADAVKAYRSVWALTKMPKETTAYVGERLKPTAAPDAQKVERLVTDLNSDRFAVRDKANQELARLGGLVEPALRKALEANPSLETRQRIEKLLRGLLGPITLPETLRAVRAVETLELIGTGEAKALLAQYAAGAPLARLTQDAKEALARLERAVPLTLPRATSRTDLYGDPLPAGAMARLGTVRFRRDSAYFRGGALAFLPGDKALVTPTEGHEIQVWDFPSGRPLYEVRTGALYVRGFALAPDGKQFAVAGFYPPVGNVAGASEVQVRALPSGDLVRTLPRKSGDHFELAFSPDSKLLFSSSSREGFLRIEEISSGKELSQRKFPSDVLSGMALSNDGSYLALSSGPNTRKLFLWKWQSEDPRPLEVPGQRVDSVSFSPDGKLLAGVEQFGTLFVWEVPSGRLLFQQDSGEADYSYLGTAAFTPDGKSLLVPLRHRQSTNRGKIQLVDPLSGRSQGTLDSRTFGGGLAVSADGRTLATTAGSGVRLWDLPSRKELTAVYEAHESDPSQIIVSPAGFLVSVGDDNTVRVWDPATGEHKRKFIVDGWVRAIGLSPDGSLLAASSFDDAVHVWDRRTGREVYCLAGHGRLGGRRVLGFLPDGRGLLSWGDDYDLRLWDMKNGKARFEHPIRPQGIKFPGKDERRDLKFESDMSVAVLTPDAKTLVLAIGGNYHLFDAGTGKESVMFAAEDRMPGSLAVSPDSKHLLASAYGDYQTGKHQVILLDLTTGTTMQRLLLPRSGAGIVAFAPDGRSYAATLDSPDAKILLYETASGNVRGTIGGFRARVRSLAFFPDSRRLASGHGDSTVLVWDLTAPEHLHKGP